MEMPVIQSTVGMEIKSYRALWNRDKVVQATAGVEMPVIQRTVGIEMPVIQRTV